MCGGQEAFVFVFCFLFLCFIVLLLFKFTDIGVTNNKSFILTFEHLFSVKCLNCLLLMLFFVFISLLFIASSKTAELL